MDDAGSNSDGVTDHSELHERGGWLSAGGIRGEDSNYTPGVARSHLYLLEARRYQLLYAHKFLQFSRVFVSYSTVVATVVHICEYRLRSCRCS